MEIDVLINSCARPDILEISINTFKQRIKTDAHSFRYVLLEDKVKNKNRQQQGKKWIVDNIDIFDEVVFSEKILGPGFFFDPVVKLCKSKYFFHLEDDTEFLVDVDIDPLIEVLINYQEIVEILLSRSNLAIKHKPLYTKINSIELTEFNLFSVATGLFNTKLVRKIIDIAGWNVQLHESKILTPISKYLNLRKLVLGHKVKHYEHLSEIKNYKKGNWKKV